jgi:hypothetical protein
VAPLLIDPGISPTGCTLHAAEAEAAHLSSSGPDGRIVREVVLEVPVADRWWGPIVEPGREGLAMDRSRRGQAPGLRSRASGRGALTIVAAVLAGLAFAPVPHGAETVSARSVFRAFSHSSEWNKPLPRDAPIDRRSAEIIAQIQGYQNAGYPRLTISSWSEPTYFSDAGDPSYTVNPGSSGPRLVGVHIPRGASPAPTSDAQMTVFDRAKGVVFKLHRAAYESSTGTWTADGTSEYDLDSNGLECTLRESDRRCPMNSGHRGIPPAIHAIRFDEVRSALSGGRGIRHTIKIALDETAGCHVYPAVGHEDGEGGVLTCEGLILRIRPGIDLRARGLSGGCLYIARALQTYGAVVGDTGGVAMEIKMENEGSSRSWADLGVSTNCFEGKISLSDFQVIRRGYRR